MINIISYNLKAEKKNLSLYISLNKEKINYDLFHQVINAYLSNKRQNLAHTKTRAEVSGTGKKPYRQKGTGSARFGSLRTPIHIGGGIAMGPRNERNYKKNLPKNMRKKALLLLLNEKSKQKQLFNIENFDLKKVSTKLALKELAKYSIKKSPILLLIDKNDKKIYLSFRNIPYIDTIYVKDINALHLAKYNDIIFIKNSYKILEKEFNEKNKVLNND